MSNMLKMDLNCDLGEGFDDVAIMPYISSCNIACGGHAGDKSSIEKTINLALQNGVSIGAHPSYPDRENFGRKTMDISTENLLDSISEQFSLIQECCSEQNAALHHFKAHGALYNDMAKDLDLSLSVLNKIKSLQSEIIIYGMAHSNTETAAAQLDLPFLREVFADRTYKERTLLMSRAEQNAVITEPDKVLEQVDGFLSSRLTDSNNRVHQIKAETICLHSDTASAVSLAEAIYNHLKSKHVLITADR